MQAMCEREKDRKLSGLVQIDDAYLGGERIGGKVGRGSENKQAFLIAVETDADLERPHKAVITPVKAFDNEAILEWSKRHIEPNAHVFSDGWMAFRRFQDQGHQHTVLQAETKREAVEMNGARWVNVVLANVNRAISGTYHAIKQAKYARRYPAEAAYRFNRRFDLTYFIPRLIHAMNLCKPCPERLLRQATNFYG